MPTPTMRSTPNTTKMIADLWMRNQPRVAERIAVLDRATTAAATGSLTPDLLEQATNIAHMLAGSLGMFGFNEGTRLARELEQHLEARMPEADHLLTLLAQLRHEVCPAYAA
jgi:HPt (histidine-containing phosphotransfer) domain-containing protein